MSNRNLSPRQFSRYTVVTEHEGGKVKSKGFDVAEDADDHAKANTPDTDGSMSPNVSDETIAKVEKKGLEYERGHVWFGNRHAVVFKDPKQGPKYRD